MAFTHKHREMEPHKHDTVVEAAECEEGFREWKYEVEAETAWLRAAEAGTPDSWREEDLERMAAAYGTPIPPGML